MFKIYQIFLIVSLFFFSGDKIELKTNKKSMSIRITYANDQNASTIKLLSFDIVSLKIDPGRFGGYH